MLKITAPHAYCRSEEIRDCDRIARKVATIMSRKAREGIKSELYISSTLRSEYDLNRKEGRGKDFRVELDSKVRSGDILIDVHSYPAGGFGDPDTLITILGDENDTDLYNYLLKQGCNVKFLYGSYLNDIVLVAKQKGARAVLIEFNEDKSTEKDLEEECEIIINWVKSTLHSNKKL